MFGLFHYRSHTVAEARSIALKGNWPECLSASQLAQLAGRNVVKESTDNERSRKVLVDESWFKLRAQSK
jgi:hypothetical protein